MKNLVFTAWMLAVAFCGQLGADTVSPTLYAQTRILLLPYLVTTPAEALYEDVAVVLGEDGRYQLLGADPVPALTSELAAVSSFDFGTRELWMPYVTLYPAGPTFYQVRIHARVDGTYRLVSFENAPANPGHLSPVELAGARERADLLRANFGDYLSDLVEVTAPDIAENGAAVPVTLRLAEDVGPGEFWLFATSNGPWPAAAATRYHRESHEYRFSTRIKMAQSGYVVGAYFADSGRVYANAAYVIVTVGAFETLDITAIEDVCIIDDVTGLDCGTPPDTSGVGVKIRAGSDDGTTLCNALMSNEMLPENWIKTVQAFVDGALHTTTRFTVFVSKNPYLSLTLGQGAPGSELILRIENVVGAADTAVSIR